VAWFSCMWAFLLLLFMSWDMRIQLASTDTYKNKEIIAP